MINLACNPARLIGAAALALAAMAAAPAHAQEAEESAIELKNIVKGKTVLNEEMGYIYMAAPNRRNAMFMKTPDAQDFEEFEAEWAEEFEKAKEKYVKRLKAYEAKKKRGDRVPEKPEEPTEETFSIGEIERRLLITVGPQWVFEKGKNADGSKFFRYMEEVEPGEYTYYGPIFFSDQGAFGSCFCMGSVSFEVKAGEITSLGDVLDLGWADNDALRMTSAFFEPDPERITMPADWSGPEDLSLPLVKADLRAAPKMNNFFRVGITRMPPMEGVLRYDRGTVIDVKGELAAKAKAEAEAKAAAEAAAAQAAAAKAAQDAAADAAAAADEGSEGAEEAADTAPDEALDDAGA